MGRDDVVKGRVTEMLEHALHKWGPKGLEDFHA
jgi:hypothetical protein